MSGKSALLLGATGAVGKHVLRELLASGEYTRVGEAGRHLTPLEQLSAVADVKNKLEQKEINFERLSEAGLSEGRWDVVFITLGTSRVAAGSDAAFEKIDREYVVNAARAAKTEDPSHKQRLVYCSSVGANANSSFLYMRSKGLTEFELAGLGYSDTIIFRPAYLANAERPQQRPMEAMIGHITKAMSYFTSSIWIDVCRELAKVMSRAGHLGSARLPPVLGAATEKTPSGAPFTIIGNAGVTKFLKTSA